MNIAKITCKSNFSFSSKFNLISYFNRLTYKIIKHSFCNKANKEKNTDISKIKIEQNSIIPVKTQQINPKLRKQLLKSVENIDKLSLESEKQIFFNKFDATNYFKHLDSDLERFFKNRSYSLENFLYLLQIQSKKNDPVAIEETFNKMIELEIYPDVRCYVQLLCSYSSKGDIESSEKVFKEMQEKFGNSKLNIAVYNSLMLAYSKIGKYGECESLLNEMKRSGLEPDIPCYTTLIYANFKGSNFDRCWEIYDNLSRQNNDLYEEYKAKLGIPKKNSIGIPIKPLIEDEYLTGLMIRICEVTHDCEKAVSLFRKMETMGYVPSVLHFNSIILALSSRKDYAPQALDMYAKMKLSKITPNLATFSAVLKATSQVGDIYTANEVVKEIKYLGYQINSYIVTGLLKTYAGAIKVPFVEQKHVDQYIKDAWELVNFAEKNLIPIDSYMLNSLLLVHCNALKWADVDGLVIPYFNKYKIKMNQASYEYILQMLLELRNFNALIKVYNKMVDEDIVPLQNVLNIMLETGMRTNNTELVVGSLRSLRENNKNAKNSLINVLSKVKDLPDSVSNELRELNKMLPYKWQPKYFEGLNSKIHSSYSIHPKVRSKSSKTRY